MIPIDLPDQKEGSVEVTLVANSGVTVFYGNFKYVLSEVALQLMTSQT